MPAIATRSLLGAKPRPAPRIPRIVRFQPARRSSQQFSAARPPLCRTAIRSQTSSLPRAHPQPPRPPCRLLSATCAWTHDIAHQRRQERHIRPSPGPGDPPCLPPALPSTPVAALSLPPSFRHAQTCCGTRQVTRWTPERSPDQSSFDQTLERAKCTSKAFRTPSDDALKPEELANVRPSFTGTSASLLLLISSSL
eukprot:m.61710 g.61710  ORF g.61710 m.61710 type:complete len:196 (-) comp49490_c0_seq1:11-598(-)